MTNGYNHNSPTPHVTSDDAHSPSPQPDEDVQDAEHTSDQVPEEESPVKRESRNKPKYKQDEEEDIYEDEDSDEDSEYEDEESDGDGEEEDEFVEEDSDEEYDDDYGRKKKKKSSRATSKPASSRPMNFSNIPIFQSGVTSVGMKRNPRNPAFQEYYNSIPLMVPGQAPMMMPMVQMVPNAVQSQSTPNSMNSPQHSTSPPVQQHTFSYPRPAIIPQQSSMMYVTVPGPNGQPMVVPYYPRPVYTQHQTQPVRLESTEKLSPPTQETSPVNVTSSVPSISAPVSGSGTEEPPSVPQSATITSPTTQPHSTQDTPPTTIASPMTMPPLGYRPVVMMPQSGQSNFAYPRGISVYPRPIVYHPGMVSTQAYQSMFPPNTYMGNVYQQNMRPMQSQMTMRPPTQFQKHTRTPKSRDDSVPSIKLPKSAFEQESPGDITRSRPKRDVKRIDYSAFDNTNEEEFDDEVSETTTPTKKQTDKKSTPIKKEKKPRTDEIIQEEVYDSEEEEEEEEKPFIEKILDCKEMSWNEAKKANEESIITLENCSMLYLDSFRVWKDCSIPPEDPDQPISFYLIKQTQRSYLHLEWVTKDLIINDLGGAQKLNRFHSKPSSHHDSNHVFNPQFIEIERILYDHHDSASDQSIRQSYYVKWTGLSLESCTWEYESDLLSRIPDVSFKIQDYFKKKVPTPAKLASKASTTDNSFGSRLPPRPAYVPVPSSPIYKGNNELRKYQLEGLNWLLFCYSHRQSCIIADEMGLGKTIQTVAFLQYLYTQFSIPGPFFIVAPLSTLLHWQRELVTWTDLNVLVYHGSVSTREILFDYDFFYRDKDGFILPGMYKFDVLVTTYEMAQSGMAHFKDVGWKVGVFDEAHRLKNKNSKAAELLRQFHIEHKILLTGTPIQNSVEELWSLLNFIQPYRFNDEEQFLKEYGNLKRSEDVAKLQALLKPIMLRRLKEDVEKSIPIKEETIIEVEMTPIQKRYYRSILERNFSHLLKGSHVPQLLNVMMELRKCCIHPFLLRGAEEQALSEISNLEDNEMYDKRTELLVQSSGKLVLVDKLLKKLYEGNHRVLIFSQMTACLDLITELLNVRKYKWERIDGSIRGDMRQAAIDRFNDPKSDSFIFLLCTRAGGVGINLTSADTVIIFDSDWNPQNDIQAQARCHRIGQTKSVKVYRLITRNSYEREMFDRAGLKLGLDRAVLQRMTLDTKSDMTSDGANSGDDDQSPTGKLPLGLSKKEVELLLKKGAYGVVMDNDEDAIKFCEEDIDQILERRTQVIQHQGESPGQQSSIFSKASFTVSNSDFDVDITDPNFWQLWAKRSQGGSSALLQSARHVLSDIEEKKLKREVKRLTKLDTDIIYDAVNMDIDIKESTSDINIWTVDECQLLLNCILTYGICRNIKYNNLFPNRSINDLIAATRYLIKVCVDSASLLTDDSKLKQDAEQWIFLRMEEHEPFILERDIQVKKGIPYPMATSKQEQEYESFTSLIKIEDESNDKLNITLDTVRILLVKCQYMDYIRVIIDDIIGVNNQNTLPVSKQLDKNDCVDQALSELKGIDSSFPLPHIDLGTPTSWWDIDKHDGSLIIGTWLHGFGSFSQILQDTRLFFQGHESNQSELAERLRKVTIALIKRRFAQLKLQELAYAHSTAAMAKKQDEEGESDIEETVTTSRSRRNTSKAPDYGAKKRKNRRTEEDLDADDDTFIDEEQEDTFFGDDDDVALSPVKRKKDSRFSRWSKHDKTEFVKLLMNIGLPPLIDSESISSDPIFESIESKHDWSQFHNLIPKLEKKTDKELDQVLYVLLEQCQRWIQKRNPSDDTKKKRKKEQEIDDEFAISFISPERAQKLMSRLHLLDILRYQVIIPLSKEEIGNRLSGAKRSGGLPSWWEAGSAHDIDFLKGVYLYGLNDPTSILNDPELSFLSTPMNVDDAFKRSTRRKKEEDQVDESLLDPDKVGWMKEPVAQRRLEYLVELSMTPSDGEKKKKKKTLLDYHDEKPRLLVNLVLRGE